MTAHGGGAVNRRRLAVAFTLTASVLIAQLVGASITGSLALLVDSVHMLTDAGGLLLALLASRLMERAANARRTWGLRRAEVLAAIAQAALLLGVGLFVVVEAVQRLGSPPEIVGVELLWFGIPWAWSPTSWRSWCSRAVVERI